jgi:hypothetical protein
MPCLTLICRNIRISTLPVLGWDIMRQQHLVSCIISLFIIQATLWQARFQCVRHRDPVNWKDEKYPTWRLKEFLFAKGWLKNMLTLALYAVQINPMEMKLGFREATPRKSLDIGITQSDSLGCLAQAGQCFMTDKTSFVQYIRR